MTQRFHIRALRMGAAFGLGLGALMAGATLPAGGTSTAQW